MREFIAKEDQITAPIAERLIRCKDCLSWKTPLAFTTTGKCAHPDHKGQITNRNYFSKRDPAPSEVGQQQGDIQDGKEV